MMHIVLSIVFENSLIFPPITRPRRILECGFGVGDWAIEVAEQHPSCEVRKDLVRLLPPFPACF